MPCRLKMLSYPMVKRMDIGVVVILTSLLSSSITHGQSGYVTFEGDITIDDPLTFYRRGDNVSFTFNATINITDVIGSVNITIRSPTLKFSNSTPSVQWTLNGLELDSDTGSKPLIDSTSNTVVDEAADVDGMYHIFLLNVKANKWVFNGTCAMTVNDDVGPGRRVQTFLDVATPILEGNATSLATIYSNYRYTPPLHAKLNPPPSNIIGIRETLEGNVSLTLTEDNVEPLVEIITVYENTSREVMLTITAMDVNGTYGFNDDVTDVITHVKPRLKSTLSSYQRDIGSVQLPLLISNGSAGSGVAVKFVLRLEDYANMSDGDVLTVGAGVKFGNSMIMMSKMNLTVKAPDADSRRPDLDLHLTTSAACAGQDTNYVDMQVSIAHGEKSNATAYDIEVIVFPLPSMTFLSAPGIAPRDYSYLVTDTGPYLRITLGRLTFSDPALIVLKMSVQMNESNVRDATHYTVPAQITNFNDRWDRGVDTVAPLEYLSVKLNKKCAERYTWTYGSSCTCAFDSNRTDCGCCIDHNSVNVVQCGEVNPSLCVPDDRRWLCSRSTRGFTNRSKIDGVSGESYECDASQKYSRQPNSQTSCFKESADGFREIHPIVGVIVGKDAATNTLYGVSSTGTAHIISEDAGKTWYTIRESVFLRASSAASYISAALT
ncbi:uncharacterized protein LOC124133124 [Haliotis rufescens]|uniref:uncharacterized protein LOC124133124 n=1 Tax=Haliotis rufescens TaxID=6454 RepID=UPI00201F2F4B|nr:uncharacterized protein LOC124133124 [Haliotis rufescens]